MQLKDYIGEATAYDKKLMLERKDPTSWLKSVSAFANTQGGRLLFGVANDGSLVGLADAQDDSEFISETIKMQMDPVPGGMPSGHCVQELDARQVTSKRRNPVIADLFQRLDLMERRGSGFKKILDAYAFESEKRGEAVVPRFESTQTDFFLILPNLNYGRKINGVESSSEHFEHGFVNGIVNDTANGIVDGTEKIISTVVSTADRIIEAIRANGQITYDGLAEVVGMSRRTISREIKALLSKGVIRRVGPDKTGHWEVVK